MTGMKESVMTSQGREAGKETGKLERRKSCMVGKPPLKHNPRESVLPALMIMLQIF